MLDLSRSVEEDVFSLSQVETQEQDHVKINFAQKGVSSFEGVLTGVDNCGTYWILPLDQLQTMSNLVSKLQKISAVEIDDQRSLCVGDIFLWRDNKNMFRVLIVKILGIDLFQVFVMDRNGELEIASRSELFRIPQQLEQIPQLLVPVQLYGISIIDATKSSRIFGFIKEKYQRGGGLKCNIIQKVKTPVYPVQADVFMMNSKSTSDNLAFILLQYEIKYYKQYSTLADWKDVAFNKDICWLSSRYKDSLLQPLPSLFGLQENTWFRFEVVAFHGDKVTVQPFDCPLNINLSNKNREKIVAKLAEVGSSVKLVEESFKLRKSEYNRLGNSRGARNNWNVGDPVLVNFQEDGYSEWARGEILHIERGVVKVQYSDYGYVGTDINFSDLRALTWEEYLQPVTCFNIRFETQDKAESLKVMNQLEHVAVRLAKVKQVDMSSGEVLASIYEIKECQDRFNLVKIV